MSANAVINTTTTGDNQIVAGVSGYRIRVLGYVLMSGGTSNVKFTDGAAGTALTGPYPLTAQSGAVAPVTPPGAPTAPADGWFDCTAGNDLTLNQSGTAQLSGHVRYALIKE